MQRREFSHTLLGAGAGWALLGMGTSQAQTAALREGSDYRRLANPVPVEAPANQVEVLEFFSYTCGHCFQFEPMLKTWVQQKPAFVSFRRVPVFSEPFQRVYYALEAIGQLEAAHDKLFQMFHVGRVRPKGTSSAEMGEWVAQAGVDSARFVAAYQSFAVNGKVKRASMLSDAYQVEGTPAVGVAGRFLVPGQAERTLPIVNALIASVRKG
ncbi:MAG TPA: thiol:disulfide interchange protein DsbA/DsbL [Macromonas sp.]|nr:thiol:disulfide interchange protein DsbA/DsbL [Macromonas sp.]